MKPKAKVTRMPVKVANTTKMALLRKKVAKPIKSVESPSKKER